MTHDKIHHLLTEIDQQR